MPRLIARISWTLVAAISLVLCLGKPGIAQDIITKDGRQYLVPKWEAIKPQQVPSLPEKFADVKFKTVDLTPFNLPGTIDIPESMEIVRNDPFDKGVDIKYRDSRTVLADIGLGATSFPAYLKSVRDEHRYELNRIKDVFDAMVDYMNSKFIRYDNPSALFVEMNSNSSLRYKGRIAVTSGDYDYWLQFGQYTEKPLTHNEALLMLHIAGTIQAPAEQKKSAIEYLKMFWRNTPRLKTAADIHNLDSELMHKIPPRRYDIFTELVNLESIYTSQSPLVDDRLLVAIKNTTTLKQLHLDGCAITDAGMPNLSALENLWWLRLSETPITDEGLKPLARLRSLRNLDLDQTQISDQGLVHLPNTSLLHLNLRDTKVTDEGLASLRRLSHLQSLDLRRTNIRGEGLNDLRALHELEGLYLDEIRELRPEFLESLSSLSKLDTLSLRKTSATPRHLQYVPSKSLTRLFLEGTPTSDEDLKHLKRFKKLKELDLTGCKNLTGDTLNELTRLGHLKTLKLPISVKAENWAKLSGMKSLTSLKLNSPLETYSPFDAIKDEKIKAELVQQKAWLQQLRDSLPDCNVDLYLR